MIPNKNLLSAIEITEEALTRIQSPVRRARILNEWAFLRSAGLLSEVTVLRELAAFLTQCAIPFRVTTPLATALDLFHFLGITPVSPLSIGVSLPHVLAEGITVRPWTLLIARQAADRLRDIFSKKGLWEGGSGKEDPVGLFHPGFSSTRFHSPDNPEYPGSEQRVRVRFGFSRLLGVTELCNRHIATPISPEDGIASPLSQNWTLPPLPLCLESLPTAALRRIGLHKPARFSGWLNAVAGKNDNVAEPEAAEKNRSIRRRCLGLLDAGPGVLVFRDQLTDILTYTGGFALNELEHLHRILQSGQDAPAERERFVSHAVLCGMHRSEAASIWNTLTRNAPELLTRYKKIAEQGLLRQATLLYTRERGTFHRMMRSIELL